MVEGMCGMKVDLLYQLKQQKPGRTVVACYVGPSEERSRFLDRISCVSSPEKTHTQGAWRRSRVYTSWMGRGEETPDVCVDGDGRKSKSS
jgi:hypothetical protein